MCFYVKVYALENAKIHSSDCIRCMLICAEPVADNAPCVYLLKMGDVKLYS